MAAAPALSKGAWCWKWIKTVIFLPDGRFRILWDVLLFILTLYQFFAASFRASFQVPAPLSFLIFDAWTDVMLILNIFMELHTAFEDKTELITDRRRILIRYLRNGDMVIDIVASFPLDFLSIIYGNNPLFRVNKVLRWLRLHFYFQKIPTVINVSPSLVRLVENIVFFLLLVHFYACLWYITILIDPYGPTSEFVIWDGIQDMAPYDKYIRAAYLAGYTVVGNNVIAPVRIAHLLYGITIVLTGAAVVATLIASTSDLIQDRSEAESQFRQKMELIASFLQFRRIPQALGQQIVVYYSFMQAAHLSTGQDEELDDLPHSLVREVALLMNQDVIKKVPLFKDAPTPFIETIASRLQPMVFLPGWQIIKQGSTGKEMFFLTKGSVEVTNGDGTVVFARLPEGSFFGEIALLMSAKRNASIRADANSVCELYRLSKDDFLEVLNDYPEVKANVERIAEERRAAMKK